MQVPARVYAFLAVGTLAMSQSGNIIRIGTAHPVAIATWRLVIASGLLALLGRKHLGALARLNGRERVLLVLSGVMLAFHFFAWIAAVQTTTVANAAIFFSINPLFVATAALLIFGERSSWKLAVSVSLGLAGVVAIGLEDIDLSPEHLGGDAWAVICALLFCVYFTLGKRLRRVLPTYAYVTGIYAVAAVVGLVCMPIVGAPLFEYDGQTWLCFVLMALLPTMIGHTSFNNALRYVKSGWLSAVTLVEPVLAGLVAYFAWDEKIGCWAVIGYVLICLSVLVLIFDRPALQPS